VLGRLPQRRPFPWRRTAVAVVVALVAAAAAIALTPAARSAFLDWIDAIPGVRIARVEKLPQSELLPDFDFGRPVTLEEARRAASFPIRLPDGVGDPTDVYLDRDGAGQAVVTIGYDRRLMLTEWHETQPLFYKLIGPGTRVDPVRVGASDGVWVSGGDHVVFYLGADSTEYSRSGRLAGRVLLWDRSGIGYRLEGRFSRQRALELARSMTP
jgi:hypothetical protein